MPLLMPGGISPTILGGGGYPPTSGVGGVATASLGWYNVKDYGALGNGVADDRAPLNTLANVTMPAAGGTMYFPPGTYVIGSALTIPAHVAVVMAAGAKISGAFTLTIQGPFDAPPLTVFEGGVTVVFGTMVPRVFGQWWGVAGGAPEGVVRGSVGAIYVQSDGVNGKTLWRKHTGTGNTGWALMQGELRIVNVLDYMTAAQRADVLAKTYTLDVRAAIQAAWDDADLVFHPEGGYRIDSGAITSLSPNDGQVVLGAGIDKTIFKEYGTIGSQRGTIYVDSGSAVVANNRKNIVLQDFTIDGNRTTLPDNPTATQHNIAFHGVTNVVLERVKFRDAQGQGFVMSVNEERHNKNVTLRDCVFDGVANYQDIAIQVGDVDGMLIDNVYITKWQRLGAAEPGVIAFERPVPVTNGVFRNIRIQGGLIFDTGGGSAFGAINFVVNPGTTTAKDFQVIGTTIITATGGGIQFKADAAASDTAKHHLVIRDVLVSGATGAPLQIYGLSGGVVDNFRAENCTWESYLGRDGTNDILDLVIQNSRFYKCATGMSKDGAIYVYGVNRFTFDNNEISTCGDTAAATAAGLKFLGTALTSDYVRITRNRFIGGGRMNTAMTKAAGHTLTSANNDEYGNDYGGLTNTAFTATRPLPIKQPLLNPSTSGPLLMGGNITNDDGTRNIGTSALPFATEYLKEITGRLATCNVSIPTATATTVFTEAQTGLQCMVLMVIRDADSSSHISAAWAFSDGNRGLFEVVKIGGDGTWSRSGTNIQFTHTQGSTKTYHGTMLRFSPFIT